MLGALKGAKCEPNSFLSVLQAAAAKGGVAVPTIEAAAASERVLHARHDDDESVPLAHNRWFQASAKAVRMSVLEHIERDKARSQVSEQLRVWAAEKVQQYSQVWIPGLARICCGAVRTPSGCAKQM